MKGRELLGTPDGRYCLLCILDLMKDSASALWKVLEIGSEIMVFNKDMGLDEPHSETLWLEGQRFHMEKK